MSCNKITVMRELRGDQPVAFEQIKLFYNMAGGSMHLLEGYAGCVDRETEFLTPTGWKKISDYTKGDKVLQVDPATYNTSFVEPEAYINIPGMHKAYHFTGGVSTTDMMLTPEHRMLLYSPKTDLPFEASAAEMVYSNSKTALYGKVRSNFNDPMNGGINLAINELRLMVAVIADGHFQSATNRCIIRLKKKRKIERLELLLAACNIIPKMRVEDSGFHIFTFDAPKRDKSFKNYWGASRHQLGVIYDEFRYWDGCLDRRTEQRKFFSTDKESIDFIQYVLLTQGDTIVSINKQDRRDVAHHKSIEYTVNQTTQQYKQLNRKHITETHMDHKYCFAVPSTFWVARRNNYVFLTGNTGKTFLLGELVDYLHTVSQGKVIVTAPTNKAVKVLRQFVTGAEMSTTHSALAMTEHIDGFGNQTFKKHQHRTAPALSYRFIVVDECSMLADDLFMELVPMLDLGIKILFVGDSMQIPPVSQKNSLPMDKDTRLEYNIGVSSLKEIIRQEQGNPIIDLSFRIRKAILRPIALVNRDDVMTPLGNVRFVKRAQINDVLEEILPIFDSEEFNKDPDHIKVIAWTNKTVNWFNDCIRGHIFNKNEGILPKIVEGDKLIADAPLMDRDKIMISTNEEMEVIQTGVGEHDYGEDWQMKYYDCVVRVQRAETIYNKYNIRVVHEESEALYNMILDRLKALAKSYKQGTFQAKSAWIEYYGFMNEWHRVKYNYAITAHKSQGSTYQQAVVLEYDMDSHRNTYEKNRILYTACTRPSKNLIIVYTPLS